MTPETIPIRLKATCTEVNVDVDSPKIMTLPLWKTCWAFWSRNGAFVPGDRRFNRAGDDLRPYQTRHFIAASGIQEDLRVRHEEFGILEQRAVTRVRIQNKLGVRNVLRKHERVDCGYHDVVIAVRHQRRLLDRLQIGIAFASSLRPFHNSRLLRLHCLNRRRRISILALMTPLPKCPAGGLTCFRRREEEKQKILADRHGIAGNFRNTRILPRFAVTRSGPDEHEAPHEMGMAKHETLRNVASDGEAEHIDLR